MTFNFLGPGLTVNVEAKVKEQIILDSSEKEDKINFLTFDFSALQIISPNRIFPLLIELKKK